MYNFLKDMFILIYTELLFSYNGSSKEGGARWIVKMKS